MQYKGIELDGIDKKVSMSHSRFLERDEGMDWLEKLLGMDKQALTHEQFHEVSALNSVLNLNYQVCNGGIGQYLFNGYHEYHKPLHAQDVAQLCKPEQVDMLGKLAEFGREIFPGRNCDDSRLMSVIRELDSIDGEQGEEDDEACFDHFDDLYYSVNGYIELLCEGYAQYLCKVYGVA